LSSDASTPAAACAATAIWREDWQDPPRLRERVAGVARDARWGAGRRHHPASRRPLGYVSTVDESVPTLHLDALATKGLRCTRFHATALCGAIARGADHGPQPSQWRCRVPCRIGDGLYQLQQHDPTQHLNHPRGTQVQKFSS
jgi:hypothetical protein